MADSLFYRELARHDPKIAGDWKKATNDNPKVELTGDMIIAIFRDVLAFDEQAIATNKITEGQANAILMLLDKARFAKNNKEDAKEFLLQLVELAVAEQYFVRGASRPLDTAQLAQVTTALKHGSVGKINFVNPRRPGIAYTSILYEGVIDLVTGKVADKKIDVVEVRAAGLNMRCSGCNKGKPGKGGPQGGYHGVKNQMLIYQGLEAKEKTILIVHEATHVIQDWEDWSLPFWEAEADAYIAGGLVALGFGQAVFKKNIAGFGQSGANAGQHLENAVTIAAKSGQPIAGNKAWEQAYDKLVDSVGKNSLYADRKGMNFNQYEPVTRDPEKARWAGILANIRKRQATTGKPKP